VSHANEAVQFDHFRALGLFPGKPLERIAYGQQTIRISGDGQLIQLDLVRSVEAASMAHRLLFACAVHQNTPHRFRGRAKEVRVTWLTVRE
jgi:hypothetical protein